MAKELIKKNITIDGEDEGMSMVAFTKRPAIIAKGMAFNSHVKPQFFSDDLKYRICAPAMIPMDIYRNDEDGEYELTFTPEKIEQIFSKFMRNYNSTQVFNLEHNADKVVPAYILEAWIVEDPATDKAFTKYGIDVPAGTLMLTTQITDEKYYEQLVTNGQVGYSIEGLFGMEFSEELNKMKLNKQTMKKTNLGSEVGAYVELPVGVWTIGDTVYTIVEVTEGEGEDTYTRNVIESMIPVDAPEATPSTDEAQLSDDEAKASGDTEPAKTELAEDEAPVASGETETKEADLAEGDVAPAAEAAPVAEAPATTETYNKNEIDAKFEELMKEIADLKAAKSEKSDAPKEEVALSAVQKLSAYAEFSRNTPVVRL